jgi:peptidyl-prolyl cis-trans isomerase SurA
MRTPLLATTKTVTALLCMLGVISNAHAQFATTIIPVTPPETTGSAPAAPAKARPRPPPSRLRPPASLRRRRLPPAPASASARVEPRPVDSILVVVNNEVITRQEVAERLASVEKRMAAQNVQLPPRQQLVRQLVERMIVERAQAQMAKENGIVVDDAMLDRAMQRIAEQNKLSMPEFRTRLEAEGMNYASFREEIRREILSQRLREREVDNKVVVTESEIDNYLAAEANAGGQRQELDIAQILIRVPENASPEQLAARRERAEDVLRQLKTGADFAKTAAAYSDSSDALSGGDLGWRPADRLPQLFLDGVAKLQDGQVSGLSRAATVSTSSSWSAAALPEHPGGCPAVQQTHVRHILIKVNQVVTAAEAKRKLTELKERLDHGSPPSKNWPSCTPMTCPPPRAATSAGSTRATPSRSSSAPWTS